MTSSPGPEHLNNRHRDTLRQIFEHPASHNIEWHAVMSLLEAVGTVTVRHDGKVAIKIGSEQEFLDPPPGKDIDTQMVVDTELRWALLQRLCTASRAADIEIDAEAERDPTDAGRRHAAACRAAVPDAAHKAAAWALFADSQDLGLETLAEAASAFAQPEHAHLLGPYADRYFEVLPDIWATRDEGGAGSFRLAFGHLLFPYPLASPQLLTRIDAFLTAAVHDQGLVRVVTEGRDVIERALRSRALPDRP